MKKIPTTVDRKAWKKWLLCPALALLLVLTSLPVYAGEQKTEVTETPTVTQETGSESVAESAASSEQDELIVEEIEPIDLQEVTTSVNSDWRTFQPHEGVVLHGGYVGFKNVGSGKYLTVPDGDTTSGTNVCMQSTSSISNAQEFYLEYIYDEAANQAFFRIYSVTSTGASSNIVRSASNSMYTANVKLFSKNVLNATERWQIEHVDGNYYCIYLASNPDSTGTRYALTATPGEGSASENTLMSSGNAVVDVYTGADNQLWEICADGRPMDINGYDITQGGSQETVVDFPVAYYYVPKMFNTTISWNASPYDYITSDGNGVVTPTNYGEMNISLSISNAVILYYTFSATLYSIPEERKTVYFSNAETGRYIDIEGPSTANDAIIQQWDYSTSSTRKWRVYYDDYSVGYIPLRSVYSTKYLAIDPNDNSIVEQTNASSDYSLWKIDLTITGNLILICKATEDNNMVLSVPLNQNSNGTDLTMRSYTDNSDYRDEWYMLDRVISYVNYYDSTFVGNTTMIQNISEANSFAHLAYSRYFHLGFYMDGAVSKYATIIDECSMGTNTPCSAEHCGLNCYTTHHKNILAISNQIFFGSREDDHVYVLWTNRYGAAYCIHDDDGAHGLVPDSALAVVLDYRPVIHFFTVHGGNDQIAYMSIILVHETAHTLGMLEPYLIAGHDEDYGMGCVMEQYKSPYAYDFYLDVCSGDEEPFCDSCIPLIENYAKVTDIVGTGDD